MSDRRAAVLRERKECIKLKKYLGVVNMIDEKKVIKKLQSRIDTFLKQHPEEKDCLGVQRVKEFIHLLEIEAKEQNLRKE